MKLFKVITSDYKFICWYIRVLHVIDDIYVLTLIKINLKVERSQPKQTKKSMKKDLGCQINYQDYYSCSKSLEKHSTFKHF